MKKLTRKKVTAAGIIAGAMVASSGMMAGCVSNNQNEDVYGPPEEIEYQTDENIIEAVYGPPEYFEVSDNEMEDVYGPPEDFQ